MLPIDPLLPEILAHLRKANSLVIEAPPGAGKTTRVPSALMSLDGREVWALEPRRLAVRLAARFVASEMGESPGGTVGYQMRFEEAASARTRLLFLTEGVLNRRLLSDPVLARAGTIVLDEFHERSLEADTALALLLHLQRTRRPDLRLVVMSATLDAAAVAAHLGSAVLRSEGRRYPLEIEYSPHSAAALEEQVATAAERLAPGLSGHVLVFLPGAAEIRRALDACRSVARRHNLLLVSLHGDQPVEEQDRAVEPSARPKIILSTNVAESSVTIDGVTAVIDSGLARVSGHSPWSGIPTLQVARVSQASAEQRAGRAGRQAPGRVIRLYPLDDFVRRPAQQAPEITRADLAATVLQLRGLGISRMTEVPWLDPPPAEAVAHAEGLLVQLGALDGTDRLTRMGREMTRYPVHPRLARLVIEAEARGVGEQGCAVAAALSAGERLPAEPAHTTRSDLLSLLAAPWQPYTARVLRQIRQAAGPFTRRSQDDDSLLLSVLAAFSDRVARRRVRDELQLAAGGPAVLSPASGVRDAALLVAVEIEDRRDQRLPLVRLASAVEPEWLLDLFPERVRETRAAEWNRAAERVEGVSALRFDSIVLEESREMPDSAEASRLLAEKALEAGAARFVDVEELETFLARVNFAAAHSTLPTLGEPHVRAALESLAQGLRSFAELESAARGGGLLRALEAQLPSGAGAVLERVAPARIRLPGGRQVRVHYKAGQPPWISSRLQDFFGLRDTPRVAGGKVPVVAHLLAPNHRPVQTTADLAGFWERLYPQVRRELARRYPKHAWPEKP